VKRLCHYQTMRPGPLVTIVTPSFNSGRFIEQAIQSVLQQDYPRIEYLVVDGGSTDETLAILARAGRRVQFLSGSDSGTADALNRGFTKTNGDILAWLNADDYYLPGAVSAAVDSLAANPEVGAVYAEGMWVNETGQVLGRYPTVQPYDPSMWSQECAICQPTCFFRRSAYDAIGGIDISLKSAFDYDLWIRMAQLYRFTSIPSFTAASRMHSGNLSLRRRDLVFQESFQLLKRHYGYVPLKWIYGAKQYSRDRQDQFFQPLHISLSTLLASLPVGLYHNSQHPMRYCGECFSKITMANMAFYLRSFFKESSQPKGEPSNSSAITSGAEEPVRKIPVGSR
jgi:glycosyltransferase involved in cell wall biosynthesis